VTLWLPLARSSMPAELALVAAPTPLWRVERISPALRFSRINAVDAMNERAGNRFDVPGAGVLYGATAAVGGYAETLAGFRPRASMVDALNRVTPEPGRVLPGEVPQVGLPPDGCAPSTSSDPCRSSISSRPRPIRTSPRRQRLFSSTKGWRTLIFQPCEAQAGC